MAIPIHTSPELTGGSAELFVKEAEIRPVTLGKLTKKEEELLERVERSSLEFKAYRPSCWKLIFLGMHMIKSSISMILVLILLFIFAEQPNIAALAMPSYWLRS